MALLKNLDVVFSNNVLEQKAAELLRRYACQQKWVPSLPIPVDSLIEHTLDLCIEFDVIEEPDGAKIWGYIDPGRRTITLNENHITTFGNCPGLERFTLGHEVGHWISGRRPRNIICGLRGKDVGKAGLCRLAINTIEPAGYLYQMQSAQGT